MRYLASSGTRKGLDNHQLNPPKRLCSFFTYEVSPYYVANLFKLKTM